MRSQLKKIEDLGAAMEEALILDNKYTEHSTVGLAQQWDQLDQLGMRMQHNLEQQIQARYFAGPGGCGRKSEPPDQSPSVSSHVTAEGDSGPNPVLSSRNTTGVTEEALKEFSMMFK